MRGENLREKKKKGSDAEIKLAAGPNFLVGLKHNLRAERETPLTSPPHPFQMLSI